VRFGEKLHQFRVERGFTQEALAGKLGVSRQAISRWELGEVVPDTENVLAVSQLFGVSTDYLLREDCFGEQDVPAFQTAQLDLRQRQQAVGEGMVYRFLALAAPALYHGVLRPKGEWEMLPFLLGWALLFGILLQRSNQKLIRRSGCLPQGLFKRDVLAVCCICFLPMCLSGIPGNWEVLISQLAAVPFLAKNWKTLRTAYDLTA